jgi:predicted Ser/Thr protein kinase
MPAQPDAHPPTDILRKFSLGKLAGESSATIQSHLEKCDTCREQVASLSGENAAGRSVTPMPDKPAGGLPPGGSSGPAASTVPGLPPALANHPQYEIVRELGRGGMGVVYLARNRQMDRLEVLKVMGQEVLAREGARQRFEREIKSAARLNHPNVVAAFSVLSLEGLLVFAMEYVEGEDLAEAVKKRGALPVANACYYAYQAALGLEHAREKGMVHRDIKPQNLILAREGKKHVVKVLDFGLAKANREKGEQHELTGEGKMLGTPHYIAPEQINDAATADIRADIYSLGCTLYCLLSGAAPFGGGSLFAILQAHHAKEAASLSEVRPEVPEALAAVVRKMMAKDPAQRYQTPGEVAQALVPFIKTAAPAGGSGQVPTAQVTAGPVAPGKTQPTSAAVKVWRSLDDPASAPRPPSRQAEPAPAGEQTDRKWLLIGGGVLAAVLLAVPFGLWLGGVFSTVKVKTDKGTLVVEVSQPGAEVYVDGEKVTVTWQDGGKKAEVQLNPGKYDVRVTKDGFTAVGQTVKLEENGRQVVAATLVAAPAPAPEAVPAPAPAVTPDRPPVPKASGDGEGPARITDAPAYRTDPEPPAPSDGSQPFFNGKDLAGWKGLAGYWHVEGGAIVGRSPTGQPAHTFLFTERTYKDFDLKFRVRRLDGVGNSGVQFRSQVKDAGRCVVVGPQCEIDSASFRFPPGSLLTEPDLKPLAEKARPAVTALYKDADFNEFHIRCVGKHVAIEVNGVTAVYGDFPSLPDEGVIALQLHGRMPTREVTFRDLQLTDVDANAVPEKPAEGKPSESRPAPNKVVVLAVVSHGAAGGRPGRVQFFSNGHLNAPDGPNTWVLHGGRNLVLRWPNKAAPGGAWLDTCKISNDGRTYTGKNQKGTPIKGTTVSGGDLAELLRHRPPATAE